jgi:hypothetical protein
VTPEPEGFEVQPSESRWLVALGIIVPILIAIGFFAAILWDTFA